jgi:hypothetical protein
LGDQGQFGVVEMEVARQLSGRGLASISAITPLLLRGQESDGYPGRSLGCLERGRDAPSWNRSTSCDKNGYHRNHRPEPRCPRGIVGGWAGGRFIVIAGITKRGA